MKKCKQWKNEKVKIRRIISYNVCGKKKGGSMAMATSLNINNATQRRKKIDIWTKWTENNKIIFKETYKQEIKNVKEFFLENKIK